MAAPMYLFLLPSCSASRRVAQVLQLGGPPRRVSGHRLLLSCFLDVVHSSRLSDRAAFSNRIGNEMFFRQIRFYYCSERSKGGFVRKSNYFLLRMNAAPMSRALCVEHHCFAIIRAPGV